FAVHRMFRINTQTPKNLFSAIASDKLQLVASLAKMRRGNRPCGGIMIGRFRARLTIAILLAACASVSASARGGVINGNFSSGNTGFTSGYGFGPTGGGHYTVGSNPKTWNSFLSSYGDHTTGSGLMLIADGSGTANTSVWSESIAVTPSTQYTFRFWASSNGNDNAN